jgi:hypothetical protein
MATDIEKLIIKAGAEAINKVNQKLKGKIPAQYSIGKLNQS